MSAAVVKIKDLSFTYDGSESPALQDIDLEIREGEFVVLTGPTGAGKSTLCYCLTGIIPHLLRGDLKGDIEVLGIHARHSDMSAIVQKVGMVLQDPEVQLFSPTLFDNVTFGPSNFGLPREEVIKRADWALEAVRMEKFKKKGPRELSGGQKQRGAIASTLTLLPEIFILDEPTSELDPVGKSEVISSIKELSTEYRKTILLVTHEMETIIEVASRLIILNDGKIRADGPADEILKDPNILGKFGIRPPQVTELAHKLIKRGIGINEIPLTLEQANKAFGRLLSKERAN